MNQKTYQELLVTTNKRLNPCGIELLDLGFRVILIRDMKNPHGSIYQIDTQGSSIDKVESDIEHYSINIFQDWEYEIKNRKQAFKKAGFLGL